MMLLSVFLKMMSGQAQFREEECDYPETYKAILPDTAASEFQPVIRLLQSLLRS
jgi:hypothetical protein